jgi:type IX secretion system PorP/SprF family membrane protein
MRALNISSSNRNKGFFALVFLLCFGSFQSKAQIETMYNLYRLNPQVLTPVQAGSKDTSEVHLMYRQQWLGIDGAPRTMYFNGNFKWKQKRGIGVNAMFDQAGPVKLTMVSGDFAYHTQLNANWDLSGGIRLGVGNVALDFANLKLTSPTDVLFAGSRSTGMMFNMGWGVRIAKKNQGFFASVSMPRILKYDFGNLSGGYKDASYVYVMLGNKIEINEDLTLYPNTLARIATDVPISWDAQLMANLKHKLDLGLTYRHHDSWGLRLGVQASKKMYIGYVYEMPTSEISKVSNQTHELGLRFFIFTKEQKERNKE